MQTFLLAATGAVAVLSQPTPVFSMVAAQGALAVERRQALIGKHRKPRVPGGSGCDDPRDPIVHRDWRG